MSRGLAILMLGAVVGLTACGTYEGGDIGNPLVRKTQWYSYVAGDDIKAWCAEGSGDRFRLVYNAIYDEQVRTYDLAGVTKRLIIHVIDKPGDLSNVDLTDPLAPWSANDARVGLEQATYDRLLTSFQASDMFGPPPVGLDLPSRSYYWTAAYCESGRYGFTAWKYPSKRFETIQFTNALFPLDPTGIPVAPPGEIGIDLIGAGDRTLVSREFNLTVGRNGLVR